jgi:eukaryotic-like serine/threonine-protein kinase
VPVGGFVTKHLAGDYELIAQLGRGGMADVYLAHLAGHSGFAKLAVVKRKRLHEDEDPDLMRMFADEARLSAVLNHPNIVQTFEVGEDSSGPFLVMEYLEGQSLGRLHSRTRHRGIAVPRGLVLNVLCETLAGLHYAHSVSDHDGKHLRIVHRDVSPENIMVTYDGQTKLVDFGVAKTSSASSETRAGMIKGKVVYMAPEQARAERDIDARTDVFSVGVILWEFLSGKRMWHEMSEVDVFARLLDEVPLPRIEDMVGDVPPELAAVCNRALAKDRSERFASAGEMLEALEAACKANGGLRFSNREVGAFVVSLFEAERQHVRAVVSGATKAREQFQPLTFERDGETSSDGGTPPRDGAGSGPSGVVRSRGGRSSSLSRPSGHPSDPRMESAPPTRVDEPVASRGRRSSRVVTRVAAAVGVLAFVAMGLFWAGRSRPTDTAVVVPPAPVPAAEVSIEVAATPSSARITLDGRAVDANPYRLRVARTDVQHVLRVEAEGYEPQSLEVVFDRDRSVNLALVPRNAAHSPDAKSAIAPVTPVTPPVAIWRRVVAVPAQRPSAVPPPVVSSATSQSSHISEMTSDKGPAKPLDTDVFKK